MSPSLPTVLLSDLILPLTAGALAWLGREAWKLSRQVRENERMLMRNRQILMEQATAIKENHDVDFSTFVSTE